MPVSDRYNDASSSGNYSRRPGDSYYYYNDTHWDSDRGGGGGEVTGIPRRYQDSQSRSGNGYYDAGRTSHAYGHERGYEYGSGYGYGYDSYMPSNGRYAQHSQRRYASTLSHTRSSSSSSRYNHGSTYHSDRHYSYSPYHHSHRDYHRRSPPTQYDREHEREYYDRREDRDYRDRGIERDREREREGYEDRGRGDSARIGHSSSATTRHNTHTPTAPRSRTRPRAPYITSPSLGLSKPPRPTDATRPTTSATGATLTPPKPSASYLALADQVSVSLTSSRPSPSENLPESSRKLVILDLNGTLLYRKYIDPSTSTNEPTTATLDHSANDSTHEAGPNERFNPKQRHRYRNTNHANTAHDGDIETSTAVAATGATGTATTPASKRVAHLRPYMRLFRSYLFHPRTRTWLDTMIWSSAQPQNVSWMVRAAFDIPSSPSLDPSKELGGKDGTEINLDHHLRAIWARDTLGLARASYAIKVQTYKDLNIVWDNLDSQSPPSSSSSSSPASSLVNGIPYSTSALQSLFSISPPSNSSHPSESSNTPTHSARTTILVDDSTTKAAFQPFNHLCVTEYTSASLERDETLLAVIGVLDALKDQSSVVGWIRAGGLVLGRHQPQNSIHLQEKGEEEKQAWFQDPEVFEEWVRRGRRAVEELGLSISEE